jgi:hypothetical protein
MAKKRTLPRKRTAFVPRIIMEAAAVVSVVPVCAACSSSSPGGVAEMLADGASTGMDGGMEFTVAALIGEGGSAGRDGGIEFSVAAMIGDGGGARLTVAEIAFDAGFDGVALRAFDAGPPDSGATDAASARDATGADTGPGRFTVAEIAFDSGNR